MLTLTQSFGSSLGTLMDKRYTREVRFKVKVTVRVTFRIHSYLFSESSYGKFSKSRYRKFAVS